MAKNSVCSEMTAVDQAPQKKSWEVAKVAKKPKAKAKGKVRRAVKRAPKAKKEKVSEDQATNEPPGLFPPKSEEPSES